MAKFNSSVQEVYLAVTNFMCEFDCLVWCVEVLDEFVQ